MKSAYLVRVFQCLTIVFLLLFSANPARMPHRTTKVLPMIRTSTDDSRAQNRILERYGNLPLTFEANRGQTDAGVKFITRTAGYTLFLTEDEAVLELSRRASGSAASPNSGAGDKSRPTSATVHDARSTVESHAGGVLRIKLCDANRSARVVGTDALPGIANYFIGNDPAKWRTNVPIYAKVTYEQVYPGIDLVYYGNRGDLEYDFVLQPGTDPTMIRLRIQGAKKLHLEHGELVVGSSVGDLHLRRLQIYQQANGTRHSIAGHFVIKNGNEVGFDIGSYNPRHALIIDPVLAYSSYLEGSGASGGQGIAVDSAGNAYIVGSTDSTDFPLADPIQLTNHGGPDAFVTKINAEGTSPVYSTYLGGTGSDGAGSIAVDSAGNAYVSGGTSSTDFPTVHPIQPTNHGADEGFVAKINAAGSALVYSTYLGGSVDDSVSGIKVDASGNAYVTGDTSSADFPTVNPIQPTNHGTYDAFVAKINAAGSALVYSTYLGGSDWDIGNSIALDVGGNAYVTGLTYSTDFPTKNPFQSTNHGSNDVFVTKINSTGSALVYSTYLGGSHPDTGSSIDVDTTGHAYLTGSTISTDFPTKNALQSTGNAFVTKFNSQGSAIAYSTYLSGIAASIALDSAGNAYIAGDTDPFEPSLGFVFVKEISAEGNAVLYSINLGGRISGSWSGAIVVDPSGSAYVTGSTTAKHFSTTLLAFQQTLTGIWTQKAFVAKIAPHTFVSVPATLVFPKKQVIGTTSTKDITLMNQGSGSLTINNIYLAGRKAGEFSQTNNCGVALLGGASCTISITFGPVGIDARKAVLGISDSDLATPQAIALIGHATEVSLSTTLLAFGKQPVGTNSAKSVTLTNMGSTPLNFSYITINGEDYRQSNTCGAGIPGGASCVVTVTFSPAGIGSRPGTLNIGDNGGSSPQKVTLTGRGV